MKLKTLASALMLVGMMGGAQAATYPTDIVDFQSASSFDTYNFSVTAPVDIEVGGFFTGSAGTGYWGLWSTNGTASTADDVNLYSEAYGTTFNLFGVGSGDYYFSTANQKAAIFGAVFTAAVPEPETYAMMLAGLGAIGFMARRRRNG